MEPSSIESGVNDRRGLSDGPKTDSTALAMISGMSLLSWFLDSFAWFVASVSGHR